MMPREDLILFLDLETTGSDEDLDEIIEVGIVMLDAKTLEEIDSFTEVIAPNDNAYLRMEDEDVVRKMHEVNGLAELIRKDRRENMFLKGANAVDLEITDWLRKHVGNDNTQIPYGGSGVAHFDRRFIKKYLPKFDKMITHWAHDVGTIRRSFVKAGLQTADNFLEKTGQAKDHRALQDARVHADEFRLYQRYFKTGSFEDPEALPEGITGARDGLKDTAR